MSRFFVVINDLASLKPGQSTLDLCRKLLERGHQVGLVPVRAVDVASDGSLWGHVTKLELLDDAGEMVLAARAAPTRNIALQQADAILVRTNPGRFERPDLHRVLLEILAMHADAGALVLSSPTGLMRAASKLYLTRFPAWTRPETLITQHEAQALEFLEHLGGRAVLKPLDGTQGRDVFRVTGTKDQNLRALISVLLRQGPVMVQRYVGSAPKGDTRLLLCDGELLERDGHVAAVRRRPARGEFRSNVHLGGEPTPADITPRMRKLVDEVGPQLAADGLFLVGLDVVGNVVVEANVYAPGGFADAKAFTGVDFLDDVAERIEARVAAAAVV